MWKTNQVTDWYPSEIFEESKKITGCLRGGRYLPLLFNLSVFYGQKITLIQEISNVED